MVISRRSFVLSSGVAAVAASGSMARVIAAASPVHAQSPRGRGPFTGYGDLVPDPNGLLELPRGFHYRVFSREGEAMAHGGLVPSSHDGMAAFSAGRLGSWLVRNHELDAEGVLEDGLFPVEPVKGATYDPDGVGGTTTLLVGHDRRLLHQRVSLAGTSTNCAGGPTPWHTWLTCEETDEVASKPHGYVFEVDPVLGGNPEPIRAMGRFEHEAVGFTRGGVALLTEDADGPHGCVYLFRPNRPLRGRGSLHAGGTLAAMAVDGVTTDLSIVQEPGTVLGVRWIPVLTPDPGEDDTPVREQAIDAGATPVMKAEGVWTGLDGSLWFVSSRGDGPDAEDEGDVSAALHSGQIWRYDPYEDTIELVVLFPHGSRFDGPDNITAGPHGFALACTDGEDDQWLVGINDHGGTFPFAFNALNDAEFAGATFSGDGQTLFVNIQGPPAMTFAIWGPWRARR
jgi:secreted PhoX family phosphatase